MSTEKFSQDSLELCGLTIDRLMSDRDALLEALREMVHWYFSDMPRAYTQYVEGVQRARAAIDAVEEGSK